MPEIRAKLRKLLFITRQKAGLSFLRVETNFKSTKAAKNRISTAFYLKDNSRGHLMQELTEID